MQLHGWTRLRLNSTTAYIQLCAWPAFFVHFHSHPFDMHSQGRDLLSILLLYSLPHPHTLPSLNSSLTRNSPAHLTFYLPVQLPHRKEDRMIMRQACACWFSGLGWALYHLLCSSAHATTCIHPYGTDMCRAFSSFPPWHGDREEGQGMDRMEDETA